MTEREHMLNVMVSGEELAKLRALAEANDEPMSATVRRWIRTFYTQAFGTIAPPRRLDPATERAVEALAHAEPKRRRRRAAAG